MVSAAVAPVVGDLAACSVFHHFDRATLRAVLGLDDAAIEALLESPAVQPDDLVLGVYRPHPARQPGLLRLLRRIRPREEHVLHSRAFAYSIEQLRPPGTPQRRARLIADGMHHLRAIHELNLHYMRWAEVEALIAALRTVAPDMGRDERTQIAIYDAYLAQRRQDYGCCQAILDSVLRSPDLHARLRAEALITRGLCAWSQAQIEGAQSDFAAALDVAAEAGDHAGQARALINHSWVLNELYQFEAALALSQRSLAHCRWANDRYGGAYALYSIGNNALYLGQWELGRRRLERAAAIYRSSAMFTSLAIVDWGRGFLHQLLGNEECSKRAYLRALRVADSAEHENSVTVADTLFQLGLIYQVQGRMARAAESFQRSIAIAERLGNPLNHALLLHRYSQLLSEQGAGAAARVELAAAITKLDHLRVSTQSQELKIGLLGTAQQVYESMVLAQLASGDIGAAFAAGEQARGRAFLDLLAGRSVLQETSSLGRPVDLAELQARLAPDALLLEFFTVGFLPPEGSFVARIPTSNERLRGRLLARPQILLFAITATDVEVHEIACDPNALRPPPGDPTPGRHMMTDRKLRWLYKTLLAPVERLLASCTVLHIIPHGPLHYVPFAALRTFAGGTLLDVTGPVLTYAPSATVLVRSLDQVPAAEGGALAIGYDDRGQAALILAEHEARLVGRASGGQAITGPAPKLAELVARSGDLRWLHIAGHAVYLPDDPMGSYLRLSASEDLPAQTIMRSLVLRGALVTLNACTSGLSHIASGDELLGLPRAFLFAGAATIMCALHDIDDLAAYTIMVFFTDNLALGMSPAVALHRAQLRLRTCSRSEVGVLLDSFSDDERAMLTPLDGYGEVPFAHPRYWAPFVVVGRP